jgi:hypothetical protein
VIVLTVAVLTIVLFLLVGSTTVAVHLLMDDLSRQRADKARIEWETRRAERRLHDLASEAFSAMLDSTRQQASGS